MIDGFFREEWTNYLRSYGFPDNPKENFYEIANKTVSLLHKDEITLLNKALLHQKVYTGIAPVRVIPYEYDCLFEGTLNLLLTDRYDEQQLATVYKQVIGYHRERQQLAGTGAAAVSPVPAYNGIDVIDISQEGSTIDYSEAPAPAVTADTTPATDNTPSYYDENAKLGHRFKEKLYLNVREADWLNKFWNPDNIFLSVEGCCIAVIRLYLACIKAVDKEYKQKDSSFETCISELTDNAMQVLYPGKSKNDAVYYRERLESDIYLTIFKRAENAVREKYRQKRKLNEDFPYDKYSAAFEDQIGRFVSEAVVSREKAIPPADRVTEIQLNAQNNTRWRVFFDEIEQKVSKDNYAACIGEVVQLAALNINNPQKENIFFEASKLFASYDRQDAVRFYLKYLHADLRSEKADQKQLPKNIHKSLFKTEQEKQSFELVAGNLVQTLNLKAALEEVPGIFAKKRRTVQLDAAAIEAVISAHNETVESLNKLLQDDEQEEAPVLPPVASITLLPPVVEIKTENAIAFADGIVLNNHQEELLSVFKENAFSLPAEKVGHFAKERKLFRDQLIESINSSCYEVLDDLLIEEYDDTYTITESYFQTITV
ncbi:TerB-C domain-containing protein [Chitinophaga sp. YR627]|uniref:tellurite resistance TerB C-terminal domain-containing protein n=1 Tax=Chitinophaga sp. YR627 TaxID=1881041 RepID=UPI0008F05966|nr:tellurite resistance TerB C-terminal domain-containing protein [Chitinophaga sp. YR627]SFM91527.1 TerB-C domain-containing protein [Chitinophaga sp. YR627]